jgi:endonuclease/exonuclease/phosphatase family metal-dependent hydrolase
LVDLDKRSNAIARRRLTAAVVLLASLALAGAWVTTAQPLAGAWVATAQPLAGAWGATAQPHVPLPAVEAAEAGRAARTERTAPAAQAANALKVMSFNIRYGTARDGDNAWELRRGAVVEVIEAFGAEVLGLQEALHFQLEELAAAMPRYERIGVGRDDGIEAGEYAAILIDRSRLEVLAQGTFWFSDTPDVPGSTSWGNDIPRICTWARLRDRASGRAFQVYNVHWDHISQPSRERSAELLMRTIARQVLSGEDPSASDQPEPVIVTGDFNAGEANPAFRRLLGVRSEAREVLEAPERALLDTFRLLHPAARDVGTFNGFEGVTTGEKIDAILVSEEWEVVVAEIVRAAPEGRHPSDHFPVTATLQFR